MSRCAASLVAPGSRCSLPQVDMEEEHEEDEEEVHLSAKDLVTIRDGVVLLVQSLLRLLKTFSLKDTRQSAINCTQVPLTCPASPPFSGLSSLIIID